MVQNIHFHVIGYYNHFNWGDEQYKMSIKSVLDQVTNEPYTSTFVDCDQFINHIQDLSSNFIQNTIFVLGGGDVLNHYFLDKMNEAINQIIQIHKIKPRTIAFSVGIPYNDIFLKKEHVWKLQIFDHIFLRTNQDISTLDTYLAKYDMSHIKVHYLPDVSCIVPDAISKSTTQTPLPNYITSAIIENSIHQRKRIVGIMLSRHIFHPNYKKSYQKIVANFANVLNFLVSNNFYVILVPFNTKKDSVRENDTYIHQDVYDKLKPNTKESVLNIVETLDVYQIVELYKSFYMTIPMRFHATLFSIYMQVPMIPIFTTKKVNNLLLDISWDLHYLMEKNDKDLPIELNYYEIRDKVKELMKLRVYMECKRKLYSTKVVMKRNLVSTFPILQSIINESNQEPIQESSKQESNQESNQESIQELSNQESPKEEPLNEKFQDLLDQLNQLAKEHDYPNFFHIVEPPLKQVAVSIVSFYFTGFLDSKYNDGLMEKMFDSQYRYQEEWEWILSHSSGEKEKNQEEQQEQQQQSIPPLQTPQEQIEDIQIIQDAKVPVCNRSSIPSFNITYIDQNDRSGAHRSGWKYVYDHIKPYNDPSSNLYLDLYLDRTFHWKKSVYKHHGIIPYKKPWIGVIHHTFDTSFSDYNNYNLLSCPEFLESLPQCRGIIVLSKTLKTKFLTMGDFMRTKCRQHNHNMDCAIPIYALKHPTEIDQIQKFDLDKFMKNTDKKMVHIGGWLRNIFTFYQLHIHSIGHKDDHTLSQLTCDSIDSQVDGSARKSLWSYLKNAYIKCCQCLNKKTRNKYVDKKHSHEVKLFNEKIYREQTKNYPIRKVILKGKYMDNYFPTEEMIRDFSSWLHTEQTTKENAISNTIKKNVSFQLVDDVEPNVSIGHSLPSYSRNNWMKHMLEYILQLSHSKNMEILQHVDNKYYDDLLTKNLVFVHLVDGSAINTVIECYVRNTPIIVNRHPAVVEVLGKDYPLYYDVNGGDSIQHQIDILLTMESIQNAYYYLSQMSKIPYHINTFCNKLFDILAVSETEKSI